MGDLETLYKEAARTSFSHIFFKLEISIFNALGPLYLSVCSYVMTFWNAASFSFTFDFCT